MGDQNDTTQQSRRDSFLEEMHKFNFHEEGTIISTIIFDNSDTEYDESQSESLPVLTKTTAKPFHTTGTITKNTSCDDIDTIIKQNVEIKHENTTLNDTVQSEIQAPIENYQSNNQSNTNTVTLEHTAPDTFERNDNGDPNLKGSEPKKQKTNFPRTKLTCRREVKKFPVKMESIKNMQRVSEPNRPEAFTEYLVNTTDTNKLAIDSDRNTPESEQRIMAALQIVAQNLINISPYINRFSKTNELNVKELKAASDALINAKRHFFALSYSTVASTILPYINEPQFMQKFYNLTFRLAYQKGIPNTFSEKGLQELCSEMIKWTQRKMTQNRNYEITQMSVMSDTTRTKELETLTGQIGSSNVQHTNNRSSLKDTTNTVKDITLVFPADHMNSAIKISYNPALTTQLAIPSQSCANVISNTSVQKNTNNYPGQQYMQHQRCPQTVQPQQQSPELYTLLQEEVSCNQQGIQQRLQPMVMPPNVIRQNPHSSIRINSCYQLPSSPQTRMFSGSNIPNRLEPYHSSPAQYPQIDMTLQRASSFGLQQANQVDQSEPNQRNFARLNNYPQERSSSRDSGFFSPVQDTYQQDCQISSPPGLPLPPPYPSYPNNTNQQALEGSRTNTKTPPMTIFRNCTVCKTLTNLTCLGCSNTYYCGNTCQNMDWNYHSKSCRKT